MSFKISEKGLITAIVLFTVGIYMALNYTENFSSKLISEKTLSFEVMGFSLIVFGAAYLYKAFKKA